LLFDLFPAVVLLQRGVFPNDVISNVLSTLTECPINTTSGRLLTGVSVLGSADCKKSTQCVANFRDPITKEVIMCTRYLYCDTNFYTDKNCLCMSTPSHCNCPDDVSECTSFSLKWDDLPECAKELINSKPSLVNAVFEPCHISQELIPYDKMIELNTEHMNCARDPVQIEVHRIGYKGVYELYVHAFQKSQTDDGPLEQPESYTCFNVRTRVNASTLIPTKNDQISFDKDSPYFRKGHFTKRNRPNFCFLNTGITREYIHVDQCVFPFSYSVQEKMYVRRFISQKEREHIEVEDRLKCENCEVECDKTGVLVRLDHKEYAYVKACALSQCQQNHEQNFERQLIFPIEIASKRRIHYTVTVYNELREIFRVEKFCEGVDICETITCTFCFEKLWNARCLTNSMIATFTFLIFLLIILCAFLIVCFGAVINFFRYLILLILRWIWYFILLPFSLCCKRARRKRLSLGQYLVAAKPVFERIKGRNGKLKWRLRVRVPKTNYSDELETEELIYEGEDREELKKRSSDSAVQIYEMLSQQEATDNSYLLPNSSRRRFFLFIILFLTLFSPTHSCMEVSVIQTDSKMCVMKSGTYSCTITATAQLSLAPKGSDLCLLFESDDHKLFGTLSINIKDILLECTPKISFYTRSHTYTSHSMFRCRSAGECTSSSSQGCEDWDPDKESVELPESVRAMLGKTNCARTCNTGLLSACKCFLVEYGCLYYKNTVSPLDAEVYEYRSCVEWFYKIKAHVRFVSMDGKTTEENIELLPGILTRSTKIRGFHLTLNSVTIPPAPITGKDFLINLSNNKGFLIEPLQPGVAKAGTVGALQCPTQDDALHLRKSCILPSVPCTCNPTMKRAECKCHKIDLEQIGRPDVTLPIQLALGILDVTPDRRLALGLTESSSLTINAAMEGFQVTGMMTEDTCVVKSLLVSGCYSCHTGAIFDYSCKSTEGDTLARVMCDDDLTFAIRCTPSGYKGSKTLKFTKSAVDVTCKVICSGGETEFALKGKLDYIYVKELFSANETAFVTYVASNAGFLTGIAKFFSNNFPNILGMLTGFGLPLIIGIVLIVILVWLYGNIVISKIITFFISKSFSNNKKEYGVKYKVMDETHEA
jgi:hypothetical protein